MNNPLKTVLKGLPPVRALLEERDRLRVELEQARSERFAQRAALLTCFTNTPLWYISSVVIENGFIEIQGFALAPEDPDERGTFTIDGEPFQEIQYPLHSDMVGQAFWYIPGSAESLFKCRTPFSADSYGRMVVFSYVRGSNGRPFNEDHNFYHYLEKYLAFPDLDRRRRVHGHDDEHSFRLLGSTLFVKLQKVLERTLGKKYEDFKSILDWGCGCGRLLRYFRDCRGPMVVGADIDEDNVQWCRDNLPFAQYEVFPLHPPTGLGESRFDLIIGISVLTHLDEREQFGWLEELRRLCAPGGIVLLTIHGETAVCRNGTPELRDRFFEAGFMDEGSIDHLADVIDDEEYYRSVFHTPDYIRNVWSKYFRVLRILPGYVGGFQDLVILQRKSDR